MRLVYLQVAPASSHLAFIVFQRFYRGPTLTTANATLLFQQLEGILNQTADGLGEHGKAGSLMEHPEAHTLTLLPETLVQCTREMPILCLLLMLGTLWLGYALYLIRRR